MPGYAAKLRASKNPDDIVFVSSDGSSGRVLPTHLKRYVTPDGDTVVAEYYPDLGSCASWWVGVVREIPIKKGTLRYDQARWFTANTDATYERARDAFDEGLSLWNAGEPTLAVAKLAESFRHFGPAVARSATMRRAIAVRVKLAFDNMPDFKDSLKPFSVPRKGYVTMRVAPDETSEVIRTISGKDDPELYKLHTVESSDGFVHLGTLGNWDMVYDVDNQDVGFVSRVPGLGVRSDPSASTSRTPA